VFKVTRPTNGRPVFQASLQQNKPQISIKSLTRASDGIFLLARPFHNKREKVPQLDFPAHILWPPIKAATRCFAGTQETMIRGEIGFPAHDLEGHTILHALARHKAIN
jgi:hypothetical protein